jgi:manganese/zinc/iron transport system permease protein
VEVIRPAVVLAVVVALNLVLVGLLWKELKATTFDPGFGAVVRLRPKLLTRVLLLAVAVTAVSAFQAVGAILVVTILIVPAATAYLLTARFSTMVAITIGVALALSPKHGLLTRRRRARAGLPSGGGVEGRGLPG